MIRNYEQIRLALVEDDPRRQELISMNLLGTRYEVVATATTRADVETLLCDVDPADPAFDAIMSDGLLHENETVDDNTGLYVFDMVGRMNRRRRLAGHAGEIAIIGYSSSPFTDFGVDLSPGYDIGKGNEAELEERLDALDLQRLS